MRHIFESGINEDLLYPKCKNLSLGEALMAEINLRRYANWIRDTYNPIFRSADNQSSGEPTISLTKIEIYKALR